MRRPTYFVPRVSLTTHIVLVSLAISVGLIAIGLGAKASVLAESLMAASFVMLFLLVYYWVMVYHGVRYDNGIVKWHWKGVSMKEMLDSVNLPDLPDLSNSIDIPSFDLADNLLGALWMFLVVILSAIILFAAAIALAWVGINVGLFLALIAWIPLYLLIRHGVRMALINVRYCSGRLGPSLLVAIVHATMGSMALGLVFFATEQLWRWLHS
jgi:hypothetical protein